MIMIQAHMHVHPSEREDFLEQIGILQSKTREESGNICSLLYEAVEEPNNFVIIEKWKNQDAVNQHNNTDHFVGFFQIADAYFAKPIQAEVHEVPDAADPVSDEESTDDAAPASYDEGESSISAVTAPGGQRTAVSRKDEEIEDIQTNKGIGAAAASAASKAAGMDPAAAQ